ncbi:DUF3857 domain-containing protein [Flavobacterium azooxidireducens]|uniref:DUF3857 domain-containing protein n=1 Tax=Flavobacterium azooxidireducens TaxID=1871076 RepID=A0ABY4KC01_9FLAO|nr:DUF3857 domain-containing protein [Flavobacterium azooxidireducens]UPQ77861.1 DUF3857 domain-containing protein [Flavobacterium azooxidireducens]
MKKISWTLFLYLAFLTSVKAQILSDFLIPKELKENANACIRLQEREISIKSRRSMTIKSKRIVTVFNEYGLRHMDAYQNYDKTLHIVSIEAKILNSLGSEIKKIKKKDFRDQSVADGFSVYTDSRVLYLDYTPISYPFTIVFECEVETSNTAFIPSWTPLENYFLSTENSKITISYPQDLGFKYKEENFEDFSIQKTEVSGKLSFEATNIQAFKQEEYAPSLRKFTPIVLFGLNKFHLEGVDGEAETWSGFGSWVYANLLNGTDELSEETKSKIKTYVGDETDKLKITQKVFEYVQNKTRYVSIQMGIGGWKPMLAKDVDKLGYGDCKALSNYTRALLSVVGVESYYTIIYGDKYQRDINPDFVSMQGNHAILCIPYQNELKWMECTDQIVPFDFQANFTDDRKALIIKSDGGKITDTKAYSEKNNSQITSANYSLHNNGSILGKVTIKSLGTQYDRKYLLERKSKDDLDKHYKNYFSTINNLQWKNPVFKNDKSAIEFTENIDLEAENYASKSGQRLMFALNAFNQYSSVPKRYRTRNSPFEISRGFYDYDDININLPDNFSVESIPESVEFNEKFGHYKAEIQLNDNKVVYKRSLTINKGFYSKTEYEEYRKFIEKIAKNDNAKLVLIQN